VRPSFVLFSFIALVTAAAVLTHAKGKTNAPSFAGNWAFSATIDTPSTTLDGKMHIVLDSGGFIIGAVKLDRHVIPFRGRHIDRRLVARSDSGFAPVLRIDITSDSIGTSLSGAMQVSRIRAVDHHNKSVDYDDLIYQFYGVRE
jgi:hypothetical protein